ncbi:hypothetical protein M427DRAFT_29656 [Gonapodya prolifera JEL478]|uniref:Hemicentin-1-like von Willebrand factor A domain-containing protein n=1 Tax=Gonapodya prolifera (strain JEL478) TaxID=1344416 RepID=A0A139AQL1_GONPJ|nr:hypothetical protein M427DRAFT_29656 [Gonapodya prolifera JEL478]|eukprot:KXS18775.1 hypothetical protein M427DRAFT_29656 [Gonapodya prolifera JEL478]
MAARAREKELDEVERNLVSLEAQLHRLQMSNPDSLKVREMRDSLDRLRASARLTKEQSSIRSRGSAGIAAEQSRERLRPSPGAQIPPRIVLTHSTSGAVSRDLLPPGSWQGVSSEDALTVQCAFLVDCTGSMSKWIAQAKTKSVDVMSRITQKYPTVKISVAFVGYRNFGDDDQYIVVDFTSPNELQRSINKVTAKGGDDAAEDVLGGLQKVLDLDWFTDRRSVRVLVNVKYDQHFCDSPGHGSDLHDLGAANDRYFSTPDPSKLLQSLNQTLTEISSLGIDYYFFSMTSHTKRMEKVLASALGSGFVVREINNNADLFLASVEESLLRSVGKTTTSSQNPQHWSGSGSQTIVPVALRPSGSGSSRR